VQRTVNPKGGWPHGHAPYRLCPPSRGNAEKESEKATEWPCRVLSSPCTCSAVTGFWQQTAISLNQSSAFLLLIPLPPPASTQQCPAHREKKETFRCSLCPPVLLKASQVCCSVHLFGATQRDVTGHDLDP